MERANILEMMETQYLVKTVEKTDTPAGCDGDDWCRYVLERDGSTLVGQRRGTVKQVTQYAEELAKDVNSRTGGRSGVSQWSSRNKK